MSKNTETWTAPSTELPTMSKEISIEVPPHSNTLENPQRPPLKSSSSFISTASVDDYFKAPVRRHFAELPMLACSFLSGLVDSTMFAAFRTFALMQTGNTIFLSLGASGLDNRRPYAWLHSLLSLICFALGAIFFSRLNIALSPALQRRTLALSFFVQAAFIFAAAALVQSGWVEGTVPAPVPVAPDNGNFNQLLAIALLSFQASGQMIATFTLDYGELSTVVVTGLLCDLWRDPALLKRKNAKRNRRAAGFVLMMTGGIAGGWICKALGNISAALWIAGGVKTAITAAWCAWPAAAVEEDKSPV